MANLMVKRLMAELKIVRRAMDNEVPWLERCEPVGDSLLEWSVHMRFPEESPLQKSLNSYADGLLDESRNKLCFQIRFPTEYPMNPPEVWLRTPRLKYSGGATPVTFGGKVCITLLSSSAWLPATNMSSVFREVREALLHVGAEVETTVALKPYLQPPVMLDRLTTSSYPKANDFQRDNVQVLSPIEAGPFFGDLSRLEATDKIALSSEHGLEIYNRGDRMELPIMFEVKTQRGRKFHCGIFDFLGGLPPDIVIVPKWVMADLGLQERDLVRVRGVHLELISFVKIQPHSVDFYEAVHTSGIEAGTLLRDSLSRFSALTEDTSMPIEIGGRAHDVQIVALEPMAAVRIIDTDLSKDFEFKVDFEPAPNLEDADDKKIRQDELLARHRLAEEKKVSDAAAHVEKRAAAIRRHFQRSRQSAREQAGSDDGKEGDVNLRLRLPGGAQLDAKFREGAPATALVALVLGSDWAEQCNPWAVQLLCNFPRRTLGEADTVTKDMHRSTISVQEQRPPVHDEEIFANELAAPESSGYASEAAPQGLMARMLGGLLRQHPVFGDDTEEQGNSLPGVDVSLLEQKTLSMFEVQRFIQAGVSPEEAVRRVDAGQTAPADLRAQLARQRPDPVRSRVPAPPPRPASQTPAGDEGSMERKIAEVKAISGAEDGEILRLLEENDWDSQQAINAFFDAM